MGWTSQHATYYKNGKVDRVAEVRAYFEEGINASMNYRVLKASLVGGIVYAAVERPTEDGTKVFAATFITSVDHDSYYNFSYKELDETAGPCYCDCPASILKLLTPTTCEFALKWREECWRQIELKRQKRKDPHALSNLPLGSVIELTNWKPDMPILRLKKVKHLRYKQPIWVKEDYSFRVSRNDIEQHGYRVIA